MASLHGWAELAIVSHSQALVGLQWILESILWLFNSQSAWTPQNYISREITFNIISILPCWLILQNSVS